MFPKKVIFTFPNRGVKTIVAIKTALITTPDCVTETPFNNGFVVGYLDNLDIQDKEW